MSCMSLTRRAAVVHGDIEGIKHDAAPASAGGKLIIISVGRVSQGDAGRQSQVAENFRTVEVVAAHI